MLSERMRARLSAFAAGWCDPKIIVTEGGCWLWLGSLSGPYGKVNLPKGSPTKSVAAHRASYQHLVGPIPEGLTLDHLCMNKRCINPAHLEPVTQRENLRRGLVAHNVIERLKVIHRDNAAKRTHCRNGHQITSETTGVRANGGRVCLVCRAARRPARTVKLFCPNGHRRHEGTVKNGKCLMCQRERQLRYYYRRIAS